VYISLPGVRSSIIIQTTEQWYIALKEKGQKDNNDLQNTTQKTKDRGTRTPLKIGDEIRRLYDKKYNPNSYRGLPCVPLIPSLYIEDYHAYH
jgi:hypothetical protein